MFECVNHQYIDIHHTKNQTEITLRSCSILVLKSLFKFMSQCNLVPHLESSMCKGGTELDNCDSTVPKPRYRSFGNVIVKLINIKKSIY